MAHLMVQDLESGVDLDKAACRAIRGGIDSVGLGAQGGDVEAAQGVYAPGSLFFASPIITTQLVFAIDTTTIVAAVTETTTNTETNSLVGSILTQYGLA